VISNVIGGLGLNIVFNLRVANLRVDSTKDVGHDALRLLHRSAMRVVVGIELVRVRARLNVHRGCL
jgi:hypothetical protein